MELTKEKMIEMGGKHWEKGQIERVYLNDSVMVKMGMKIVDSPRFANEIKSLGKNKLWFDCESGILHSDKGLIRTAFNASGFECKK